MVDKEEIMRIIKNALKEAEIENKVTNLNTTFIGTDSSFESIDIVQIISTIEDHLENMGFEGFNLLEKVFSIDKLNLDELAELILQNINK